MLKVTQALLCILFSLNLLANDSQFIFDAEGFELTKLDYLRWHRKEFMEKYIYPMPENKDHLAMIAEAKSIRKKTRLGIEALDFVKCSPIKGVKLTYFCLYYYNQTMTDSLARLSTIYEGDSRNKSGTFVNFYDDPAYFIDKNMIAGHNMNSTSMREFFQRANDNKEYLTPKEKRFQNSVFATLEEHSKGEYYEFITASIQDNHRKTLSHEGDHALFGSYPEYKETVYHFWDNVVTEEDKKGMLRILTEVMHYPKDDIKVLRDEFQAFLLMEGAESSAFYEYVGKYQGKLFKALVNIGIRPAFRDGPDIPLCEEKMTGPFSRLVKKFIR